MTKSDIFSLIIPTFNRPFFLQRLLDYYVEMRVAYPIVVADSSSGSSLGQNQKIIERARQVLRLNHQFYSSNTDPYAKLSMTLRTLESPYAAVCADDDFIVPEGIAKCVEFLEQNTDYSIAHGCATAVLTTEPEAQSADGEIMAASTYPQRTNEFDSPAARLDDHLSTYTPTYYSVHRRDLLAANLLRSSEQTVDYRFGELLASCLDVVQGKAKQLEVLYMVRKADLDPPKYSEKMLVWDDLLMVDDFSVRYSKFRDCLAIELMNASASPREAANAVVDRAFFSYVANRSSEDAPRERQLDRVLRIIQTLPRAARAAMLDRELMAMIENPRMSYRRIAAMHDRMSLPSLLNSRSSFHSQFMNVYRHLQSPGA